MRLLLCLVATLGCAGCDATAPRSVEAALAPKRAAQDKPQRVAGGTPVRTFVAAQLAAEPKARTLVYVGASWCEPCQRFHHALEAGQLDTSLRGVRFIEYDYDTAKADLEAAGCTSRLIPLFAIPKSDGTCGQSIEGSIKGDGALANIMPRLAQLLGAP